MPGIKALETDGFAGLVTEEVCNITKNVRKNIYNNGQTNTKEHPQQQHPCYKQSSLKTIHLNTYKATDKFIVQTEVP